MFIIKEMELYATSKHTTIKFFSNVLAFVFYAFISSKDINYSEKLVTPQLLSKFVSARLSDSYN